MPYLIRTPEDIFRTEAKDIYLIRFRNYKDKEPAASKEIKKWIATNLPGTHVEPLAPSEHSGWITGYFGDLRVDFSQEGLEKFCARWETPEGKSTDRRFQCYVMPYQEWFEKYGHYVPTNQPPSSIGITVWIDTPIGFIYHQLTEEEAAGLEKGLHPAKPRDLWMHAIRQWPELKEVDIDKQTYGEICRYPDASWGVIYSDDPINRFTDERKAALREWFKLPVGTEIVNEFG